MFFLIDFLSVLMALFASVGLATYTLFTWWSSKYGFGGGNPFVPRTQVNGRWVALGVFLIFVSMGVAWRMDSRAQALADGIAGPLRVALAEGKTEYLNFTGEDSRIPPERAIAAYKNHLEELAIAAKALDARFTELSPEMQRRVSGRIDADLITLQVGIPDGDGLKIASTIPSTNPISRDWGFVEVAAASMSGGEKPTTDQDAVQRVSDALAAVRKPASAALEAAGLLRTHEFNNLADAVQARAQLVLSATARLVPHPLFAYARSDAPALLAARLVELAAIRQKDPKTVSDLSCDDLGSDEELSHFRRDLDCWKDDLVRGTIDRWRPGLHEVVDRTIIDELANRRGQFLIHFANCVQHAKDPGVIRQAYTARLSFSDAKPPQDPADAVCRNLIAIANDEAPIAQETSDEVKNEWKAMQNSAAQWAEYRDIAHEMRQQLRAYEQRLKLLERQPRMNVPAEVRSAIKAEMSRIATETDQTPSGADLIGPHGATSPAFDAIVNYIKLRAKQLLNTTGLNAWGSEWGNPDSKSVESVIFDAIDSKVDELVAANPSRIGNPDDVASEAARAGAQRLAKWLQDEMWTKYFAPNIALDSDDKKRTLRVPYHQYPYWAAHRDRLDARLSRAQSSKDSAIGQLGQAISSLPGKAVPGQQAPPEPNWVDLTKPALKEFKDDLDKLSAALNDYSSEDKAKVDGLWHQVASYANIHFEDDASGKGRSYISLLPDAVDVHRQIAASADKVLDLERLQRDKGWTDAQLIEFYSELSSHSGFDKSQVRMSMRQAQLINPINGNVPNRDAPRTTQ